MRTAATGLKELHHIHIQLHSVKQKLESGPRQIKARERFTQQKREENQKLRDQLKQLKMASDQKSLQLKTNEAKITDLKVKLNVAASNREFDIIRAHIDADTMANSVLEDEILELFEKIDAMQTRIAAGDEEIKKAESEQQRIVQVVAAAEPGLANEAEELAMALRSAESLLPGTVLETYRRLVQAHGSSALASVEGKACTACNAIVSPQFCVDLNTGKIVFCRSCGRLLYREDDTE